MIKKDSCNFIYSLSGKKIKEISYEEIQAENMINKNNIYFSLNEFRGGRRKEIYVKKFIYIGIDLDNKKIGSKEIYKYVKEKVGTGASSIIETYKGYHIYFKLESELNYISIKSYKTIYDKINNILGGDKNMRSVTGILKVPETIDYKDDRDYYIDYIQNSSNDCLSANFAMFLTGLKTLGTLEYIKKNNIKDFINDIDVLDLITKIEDHFDIDLRTETGFKGVGGLKYNSEGNYLYDFSKKGRNTNYNFLFSYLKKEFNINHIKMNGFLKRTYGITLRTDLTKKDFYYTYGAYLIDLEARDRKILRGIHYLNYKQEEISILGIINILGLSKSQKNRKIVEKSLTKLLKIRIPLDNKNFTLGAKLFDIKLSKVVRNEMRIELDKNLKAKERLYGNIDIIKEYPKDDNMFLLLEEIEVIINNGRYERTKDFIYNRICPTDRNTARRKYKQLKKILKKLNIAKTIKEEGNKIIIF